MTKESTATIGSYNQFRPLVVIGFGLCWSVTFIFAYSFIFTPINVFSPMQRDIARVGYLVAIPVAEALIYLFSNQLQNSRRRVALAIGAIIALAIALAIYAIAPLFGASIWLLVATMPIGGLWQGVNHILWSELFTYFGYRDAVKSVYLAVGIGALLFIGTTSIAQGNGIYAAGLLAFFSLVCYIFTEQFEPGNNRGRQRMSRKLFKELYKSNVTLIIYGAVFGVGIYACMVTDIPTYISYPLTGTALGLGAFLLLAVGNLTDRVFSFGETSIALVPAIAVVLVFLTLASAETAWFLYLALLVLLTMFDTSSFGFMFEITERLNLQPIQSIARGRIFVQVGMALAGSLNLIIVYLLKISTYILPLVLIVFLFIMVAVTSKADLLPQHLKASSTKAPQNRESENTIRLRVISDDYDLSKREQDVLRLLMRGYSTQAIADSLFISINTVKSHISHIHRKMGVNSKQEIIELCDSRMID